MHQGLKFDSSMAANFAALEFAVFDKLDNKRSGDIEHRSRFLRR
jgi:hypothetical protein